MLSKNHRLAKTKEVRQTLARGRGFFNPLFSLKFFFRPGGRARFTFIVSAKVSKKAVNRNRLKRILRETVRRRMPDFVPGDYAVILKPKAAAANEPELLSQFQALLIKNRLLNMKTP